MSCRIQITFTDGIRPVGYYEAVTDDMATAQQFADRHIKGKWPKVDRVDHTDRVDGGEKEDAK